MLPTSIVFVIGVLIATVEIAAGGAPAEKSAFDKLLEHLDALAGLLLALATGYKWLRARADAILSNEKATKLEKGTQILVVGFEALAKAAPAKAQEIKDKVEAVATKAGVETMLHEVVVKMTKDRKAVDESGNPIMPPEVAPKPPDLAPPKLASWFIPFIPFFAFVLLVLPVGCVSREVHELAAKVDEKMMKFAAASQPHESYKTELEKKAWRTLRDELKDSTRALAEATK